MPAIAELAVADWHRLNRLLEAVLALDGALQREQWLRDLSQADADLEPLLRRLLSGRGTAETGAFAAALPPPDEPPIVDESPGQTIGPYRLLRQIGHGGMGTVWLAERADGAFERQVALKLPRAQWSDRALAQRFARERAVLASLNHPNIAQLFDAGWTDAGRPYLALEHVDGLPITDWCAQRQLDVPARVALLIDVIRAVAYAHARLIVHRDLKPSNVLVTANGAVKLLDFGIAKLLSDDGTAAEETELTRQGGRVLTPQYAAPEQLLGHPVSTAADTYALGVLSFELLTGARPYRLSRETALRRSALEEAILRAEVPAPSSEAVDPKLRRALRGDLDAIVLKALAKLPEQRYEAATAFADDLERHLSGLPVRAQRASRLYRAARFVARNRLAVGAAAAVLVALSAGLSLALWQASVARGEAQRANLIKDFVLSIIQQADPVASRQTREADIALLTTAAGRVDQELAGHPELALQMRRAIGAAYRNRGDFARATAVLRKGIEQARPALPADHVELLRAFVQIADEMLIDGRRAKSDLDEAILRLRARGESARPLLSDALVAHTRLVRWNQSWKAQRASIDELWSVARATGDAGRMLEAAAEAIRSSGVLPLERDRLHKMMVDALEQARRQRVDPNDPRWIVANAYQGLVRCQTGQKAEGLGIARDAMDVARTHHGADARVTEEAQGILAMTYRCAGDPTSALQAAREAYRISLNRDAPESQNRDLRRAWLVNALFAVDRTAEIPALLRESPPTRAAFAKPDIWVASSPALDAWYEAWVQLRLGDSEAAERIAEGGIPLLQEEGATPVASLLFRLLARTLFENGKFERAESFMLAAIDQTARDLGPEQPTPQSRGDELLWLARIRAAAGLHEAALADADRASTVLAEGGSVSAAQRSSIDALRGQCLLGMGRSREALELLAAVHEAQRERNPAGLPAARGAWWHAQALLASGQPERARALLQEAAPALARSRSARDRALAASAVN